MGEHKAKRDVPRTDRTYAQAAKLASADSVPHQDLQVIGPTFTKRKTRDMLLIETKDLDDNVEWLEDETLHALLLQKHEELSELINATIYFCHPQCPQEKGTVENRNKAIRRYIKKKTDLSSFSKEYISEVERKLRDRFMKCLDYETPREVFECEIQKTN